MHATRSMPSLPVPSLVVPPVPVLPTSISDFGPATTATPSRPSSPPPPSYDETIFQIFTAMESLTTSDSHPSSAPTPAGQIQNSRESTNTREAATTPTSVPMVPTPSTLECSLCLDREDNLSSLACGHIFGTECIREALQDDSHCPLCRNEASIKDLRRVFLT
ncbi:uncharacterized protein FOMMEDRAFT_132581 [Fomitiporia mediterranea MF3/22]|uniref:uncharacterized protein n=1 Tax=Fomitiporia mediterranea (strain MF3/22) TaxID=694068 RepID=UPI0004407D31|nr:uncharacterized protein FOMMEDRAFT_132581 [Fomitiporia mediterranea MF3/22]EJD06243.1 hypothetical protein FOMMEDRAFT_132581 [Fomitiporia mediterranea MF3/22]